MRKRVMRLKQPDPEFGYILKARIFGPFLLACFCLFADYFITAADLNRSMVQPVDQIKSFQRVVG